MTTFRFLITNMSDRRRCPRCHAFVAWSDLDAHAASHGVAKADVRVEQGVRV